ncbi:hypothetical protein JTB14_023769 [Gonioctena quinquepunctata]|nr:hypothetical protein JTB14_023769 [Gonioctena quinquepunctata]
MFSSEEDLQEFGGSHVTLNYLSSCSTLPIDIAKMKHETLLDPALKDISSYVRSGWPSNSKDLILKARTSELQFGKYNDITKADKSGIAKDQKANSAFKVDFLYIEANGNNCTLISELRTGNVTDFVTAATRKERRAGPYASPAFLELRHVHQA